MKASRGLQVAWAIPVLEKANRFQLTAIRCLLRSRMGFSPCGHDLRGYVAAVLVLLNFVGMAQAKYSGGTGEPNDPYQIATAAGSLH